MLKPTVLFFAASLSSVAMGALAWDTTTSDGGTITAGSGTWDLATPNWNDGSGNTVWVNTGDANFAGGSITVGASAVTAGIISVTGGSEVTFSGTLSNLTATTFNINTTGGGKVGFGAAGQNPTIGAINIASGATLYAGAANIINSAITVGGSGNNENRGALRIDAATLQGTVMLTANTTFGNSSGNVGTIQSVISGGFAFNQAATINASGVTRLSGNNTYTGGTTFANGILQAGHNNAFGTGTLTQNGGTLSSDSTTARTLANAYVIGGNVTLGNATNSGQLTFSNTVNLGGATRTVTANSVVVFNGVISNGALTRAGSGDLSLTAANTYAGGTTLNAGRTNVSNAAGFGTGVVTVASGAQAYLSAVTVANNFVLNGGSGTDGRGVLRAANSTVTGTVTLAGNSVVSGAGSETATISGVISETGGARVLTVGATAMANNLIRLTLTGANTYTGGTVINGGTAISTLVTGNTAALGAGNVTLAGGVLQIGNGTVNTVTFGSGANLVSTTATVASVLRFNASGSGITLAGGKYDFSLGSVTIDLNNAFNSANTYTLITGGAGNVDATSYAFLNTSAGFNYAFANGTLTVSAVPEPASYALAGVCALAVVAARRRRKA